MMTSFFTITVSGPGGMREPGNYDPIIPIALWMSRGTRNAADDEGDVVFPPKTDTFYQAAKKIKKDMKQEEWEPKPWWTYVM